MVLATIPTGRADWIVDMYYKIPDIKKSFEGRITENLGNNEYVIRINDNEHKIRVLKMTSKGIEFILDSKYHSARYLEQSSSEMNLVIDNVLITLNINTHLDQIVYKNTGQRGPSSVDAQLALKSPIPGKVVSIAVVDGDSVTKGNVVCTLESMKMQVAIRAHKDGTVKSVKIKESDTVAKGDIIAEIE